MPGRGSDFSQSNESSANTALTVTLAAVAGVHRILDTMYIGAIGASLVNNGTATIEDGSGNVIARIAFGAGEAEGAYRALSWPSGGLRGSANTAMIIVVPALGASVISQVNVTGRLYSA